MSSTRMSGELHMRIPILGLGCAASEALLLERQLGKIPGVLHVYVNPATETAYLQCDPALYEPEQILVAIATAGLRPGPIHLR